MLDTSIQTKLATRLNDIPPELREPIIDGSVRDFVKTVSKKYGLTQQQETLLENELALTFLGYELISSLQERISKIAVISEEITEKIVNDMTLSLLSERVLAQLVETELHFDKDTDMLTQSQGGEIPEKEESSQNILEQSSILDTEEMGISPKAEIQPPQPTHLGQEPIEPQDTQMFGEHSDKEPVAPPVQQTAVTADTSTTSQEPTTPLPQGHETTPTISAPHKVEQMHTMEKDIDKIHGYGAYRKMYPDTHSTDTNDSSANEEIRHATSQEDVLKRPPLSDTPSYKDTEK